MRRERRRPVWRTAREPLLGLCQAVKLLHRADHVNKILDHMHGLRTSRGRVRKMVEVANNVGAAGRVAVDADRASELMDAATDVERSHEMDDCSAAVVCFVSDAI